MTATITLHPEPLRVRPHRVSARTYRRRRALVGGVAAVVVAVGAVGAFDALSGGAPAGASVVTPAGGGSVVARSGDTLWAIAAEHRGDVPVGRYVDALVDLNGGASIRAGQRVLLP